MAMTDPSTLPFVAPCRNLPAGAAFGWLAAGWRDLRRSAALSMLLGGIVALISIAVSLLAYWLGRFALLATLLSGFVFIAPLLGVALYSVSRDLEQGRAPSFAHALGMARRVVSQAAIFALAQLIIVLLWSRAGMMVQAFNPVQPGDTRGLLELLAYGSLAGSVFAAVTFATAVLSLPMIADREVDMITACISSVHAVLRNRTAMLVWAALIALLTGACFVTAGLGFVIIMPWIAYAAWHGYRETIDAEAWPLVTA